MTGAGVMAGLDDLRELFQARFPDSDLLTTSHVALLLCWPRHHQVRDLENLFLCTDFVGSLILQDPSLWDSSLLALPYSCPQHERIKAAVTSALLPSHRDRSPAHPRAGQTSLFPAHPSSHPTLWSWEMPWVQEGTGSRACPAHPGVLRDTRRVTWLFPHPETTSWQGGAAPLPACSSSHI